MSDEQSIDTPAPDAFEAQLAANATEVASESVVEEVIVEGRNKRDEEKWTGRTRQNKLVHFSSNEMLRVGQYAMVEIHDAARFHLSGVLTEVGEMPTEITVEYLKKEFQELF